MTQKNENYKKPHPLSPQKNVHLSFNTFSGQSLMTFTTFTTFTTCQVLFSAFTTSISNTQQHNPFPSLVLCSSNTPENGVIRILSSNSHQGHCPVHPNVLSSTHCLHKTAGTTIQKRISQTNTIPTTLFLSTKSVKSQPPRPYFGKVPGHRYHCLCTTKTRQSTELHLRTSDCQRPRLDDRGYNHPAVVLDLRDDRPTGGELTALCCILSQPHSNPTLL